MSENNIELTGAEWSIIQAVWDDEPCTAPAIQKKLHQPTGWHYSTVRTLMDRMVAKGALTTWKTGKSSWYRSALTREQAQRGELLYTLRHAFNGALTPMVQCLLDSPGLNAAELAKIEALIQARKNAAAAGGMTNDQ